MKALCGLDCSECEGRNQCGGCAETKGRPFGGSCMIAVCCEDKRCENCGRSFESSCKLKMQLIAEFNALGIEDMEEVTDLNALQGAYINLQYTLPGGQKIKFWDDDRVYLGNQIGKKNSDRCYGLTADEDYLLVCEYGENGSDAEIIVYRKRRGGHGTEESRKLWKAGQNRDLCPAADEGVDFGDRASAPGGGGIVSGAVLPDQL